MKNKIRTSYSKHAVFAFILTVLITYAFSWYDIIHNDGLTGAWLVDFRESMNYWYRWVLPFWWLVIILGTFSVSILSYVITYIVKELMKKFHY